MFELGNSKLELGTVSALFCPDLSTVFCCTTSVGAGAESELGAGLSFGIRFSTKISGYPIRAVSNIYESSEVRTLQ